MNITERDEFLIDIGKEPKKSNEEFVSEKVFRDAEVDPILPEMRLMEEANNNSTVLQLSNRKPFSSSETECNSQLSLTSSKLSMTEQEEDGFSYVLGYIAKKYQFKYPGLLGSRTIDAQDVTSAPCFVEQLSYGGLMLPTPYWIKVGNMLEKIFRHHHGSSGFRKNTNVVYRLYKISMKSKKVAETEIPSDVVKSFVKMRTIMRIRFLNMKHLSNCSNASRAEVAAPSLSTTMANVGLKRKIPRSSSKKTKKMKKIVQ